MVRAEHVVKMSTIPPIVNVRDILTEHPKVTRSLTFFVQGGWWRTDRDVYSVLNHCSGSEIDPL